MGRHGVSWGQAEMGHLVGAASILLRRGVSFLWQGTEGLGPAFPGWQGQLDLRRHDGEEAVAGAAGTVRATSLATPPPSPKLRGTHASSWSLSVSLSSRGSPGGPGASSSVVGGGPFPGSTTPKVWGGPGPGLSGQVAPGGRPGSALPVPPAGCSWAIAADSAGSGGGEVGQRALGTPGPYPRAL